ncbi:pyrroline-5-carboxylate reductase [Candidatus Heimdallarchaeota archaeon B3_Heim]|nr:MAG: pyrroline-5-carboxylate reductase [Candidatus Heimdallarchaeota archaeon B3_Heim]
MSNKPRLSESIGVIGTGIMGTSLIRGLLKEKLVSPDQILAYDIINELLMDLVEETGINAALNNQQIIEQSDIIFICVKPQVFLTTLQKLQIAFTSDHLVISIAAGVPLSIIEELTGNARCVRIMPNMPFQVGEGAAGYSLGTRNDNRDSEIVEIVFGSLGKVFQFPEYLLDAVTGLSGTGPAYVFVFIEALADGGVLAGLPRREALILSAQTVMGAAKLLLEQNVHPGILRDAIMSPGGTTASALQLMEARGFRSILIDAVEAATKKSQFLGQNNLSQSDHLV